MKLDISSFIVSQSVNGELVLKESTVKQTKTGKDYLAVTLTDGTDDIQANFWNWKGVAPEAKHVYCISATVGEYNGIKQLTLDTIALDSKQDMSQFVPDAGYNREIQEQQLKKYISTIEDGDLHGIVNDIYSENWDRIFKATSAKGMHHVGMGGNIEHTLEVCRYASALSAGPKFGCYVKYDLVTAGALLHDIGKIKVYEMVGPVIDYTTDGHLFDHIGVGMQMLEEYRSHFNRTETFQHIHAAIDQLEHIVLSHHGTYEMGSAVLPHTLEAYIVHMADLYSAHTDSIITAMKKAEGKNANMTDKVFAVNNMPFLTSQYIDSLLNASSAVI